MKIVMDHKQYLEYKYENKTTLDIKLENLGIRDAKRFERECVIGLACALVVANHCTTAYAADTNSIDDLGNKFLIYIRKGGRWIAIICASIEIIRSGMRKEGSPSEIGKVILRYSLLYGSLYIITWIFDEIEKTFY